MPGLPLLGNLLDIRRDRLGFWQRVAQECGDIGQYRLGQKRRMIIVNSPDYVQKILVDHDDHFDRSQAFRAATREIAGDGLFNATHQTHRRQRKLVAPIFQPRHIAAYATMMATLTERAQQRWHDGATIDIAQEMGRLTLAVAGYVLFASDIEDEAQDLGTALRTVLSYAMERFTRLARLPWQTARDRAFHQAMARLDATIQRMITEQRAATTESSDLLSLLLKAHDQDDGTFMTDQQVRDEAMTFLIAGHETTASTLTWAWYLLAHHPEAFARLRGESDDVLAGRLPTFADLQHLPYSQQVLKETLRLYSPGQAVTREVIQSLDLDGYQLPVGAIIIVAPYLLHRRADLFPDPERFDPDRWTPEFEQRLPRQAYLPFGAGPRQCIGNHFAMMEGQIVLATLARHLTFELVSDQQVGAQAQFSIRPSETIQMVVRQRERTLAV
jgi:cytochrome P450